jgi:hypothetical protein
MDTAFLIPSTTRGLNITSILDTPLYKAVLQTNPETRVKYFIGFDHDDPIYSKKRQRKKLNASYNIEWVPQHVEKGHVTQIWNNLAEVAIKQGHEYMYVLGDDIYFETQKKYLMTWEYILQKRNNIGWCAGFSGNDRIATQFFIHKSHYEIFGFIYPPLIKNWFCDDWLHHIYNKCHTTWTTDFKHLNVGGEPRYIPNKEQISMLVPLLKRHKNQIQKYISKNKNITISKDASAKYSSASKDEDIRPHS